MVRRLIMLVVLAGFVAAQAAAGQIGPVIPKATGDPHPEGNEFMRINHMNLMKHDRDKTVRLGDRTISYSLKACVECHAVQGDDGQPVGADDDTYFCRVCHDFAAVKIDCFECHNAKPAINRAAFLNPQFSIRDEILAYLNEASE